jgi:hypothetical protein
MLTFNAFPDRFAPDNEIEDGFCFVFELVCSQQVALPDSFARLGRDRYGRGVKDWG